MIEKHYSPKTFRSHERIGESQRLYEYLIARPEEPSDYGEKVTQSMFAHQAWVGGWHTVMIVIAQHLSYDSFSDRLKALRKLQLHPPGAIDGFPDWIQILGNYKNASLHLVRSVIKFMYVVNVSSNCYFIDFFVCNAEYDCTPSE